MGRFMYHCHILEHEGRDTMRPIVVTPKEVMDSTGMPGKNGTDPRMRAVTHAARAPVPGHASSYMWWRCLRDVTGSRLRDRR
jgi:Multicopper oxidase